MASTAATVVLPARLAHRRIFWGWSLCRTSTCHGSGVMPSWVAKSAGEAGMLTSPPRCLSERARLHSLRSDTKLTLYLSPLCPNVGLFETALDFKGLQLRVLRCHSRIQDGGLQLPTEHLLGQVVHQLPDSAGLFVDLAPAPARRRSAARLGSWPRQNEESPCAGLWHGLPAFVIASHSLNTHHPPGGPLVESKWRGSRSPPPRRRSLGLRVGLQVEEPGAV